MATEKGLAEAKGEPFRRAEKMHQAMRAGPQHLRCRLGVLEIFAELSLAYALGTAVPDHAVTRDAQCVKDAAEVLVVLAGRGGEQQGIIARMFEPEPHIGCKDGG